MALARFISDLVGTLQTYFKIGTIRITDNSGVVEAKNAGGTAYTSATVTSVKHLGANASNGVVLSAPSDLADNVTLTLPGAVGTIGWGLVDTDGAGTLGFAASGASNAELCQVEAFTEATSSPLTIFAPPDNCTITRVQVLVSAAAAAGSPTISIGVAGTAERDMAAAEVDLKTAGLYEVQPLTALSTDPGDIIATITPSAQTFTGKVYLYYATPA